MTNDSILFSCFAIKLNAADWAHANVRIVGRAGCFTSAILSFYKLSIQMYEFACLLLLLVLLLNAKDYLRTKLFNFEEFPVEKSFSLWCVCCLDKLRKQKLFPMIMCVCLFFWGWVVCLSYSHHHNVDTIIELNVGIFLLKNNFKLSLGGIIIWRCRVEFAVHHQRWTTENFVYSSHIDLLWGFKWMNECSLAISVNQERGKIESGRMGGWKKQKLSTREMI